MAGVIPVPTSRTSDLLLQVRLLSQLQSDQAELLKLQTQLSTGLRLLAPSDDAPAAIRAISLQSLLEQKDQIKTDLGTNTSYLNATDNTLSGVSNLLIQLRAEALGVAGNTASDQERQAFRETIRQSLAQLVSIGNQNFRGRYLFSGSRTNVQPFTQTAQGVSYSGNEISLRSFADVGLLVDSGVTGDEVFGAISPAVRGISDFNPVLTENTRLSDLRGGLGIRRGSVEVSDGSHISIVDLSGANTIGDVIRQFASHPPAGRTITARITGTGLTLQLDNDSPGNLSIHEVGGGTTAAELGIYSPSGVGTGLLSGSDLDPQLTLTTNLADVFGARARLIVESPGDNNNLVLTAKQRGTALNGATFQFVDDSLLHAAPPLAAGSETARYNATAVAAQAALHLSGAGNDLVLTATTAGTAGNGITIQIDASQALGDAATTSYNAGTKTLTLHVDSTSQTTLSTLATAINGSGLFTAAADTSNGETYNPAAVVNSADGGTVSGNTGQSGAEANSIQVFIAPGASSGKNVLDALQASASVAALFDSSLDDVDTTDIFSGGEGLVLLTATGTASGGAGEEFDAAAGIQIRNGGQTYTIQFSSAKTVEDLLNAINGAGASVVASLNASGTGIDVRSRLSGTDFAIGENGGRTAAQLGIRSFTRATQLADLNFGRGVEDASGADFTITRADGVVLNIDLAGAKTVGDVLDLINNDAANQNPLTRVVAQLAAFGNGIELIDSNTTGANSLTVTKAFRSSAAWDLGLVAKGGDTAVSPTAPGTVQSITSSDSNPLETKGIFNTLFRLDQAMLSGNDADFARAQAMLNDDLTRLTFARSEVGARGQALDSIKTRLDSEKIELQSNLSNEIDTDFTDSVSKLAAKQASIEASLRLIARSFQLTLLNFL